MMNFKGKRQTGDVRRQMADGRSETFYPSDRSTRSDGCTERGTLFTHHSSRITYCVLLTAACILVFSGCEQTFQPLQENDRYFFSIYGYLDASADTQWVRVTPARQELNMAPEVPDMQVTLEHLQSGDTATMSDSLFVSESGFNYLNFWTTMEIEPGQTYRLVAERQDGSASRVAVTTPEEFPPPRFSEDRSLISPRPRVNKVIINGVENLVDVQTWWYVRIKSPGRDEKRKISFSYRNEAQWVLAYGDAYVVEFSAELERERIRDQASVPPPPEGEIEILHRQVYVASAGPEWDEEIASLDDVFYALHSNVEGGLGYMVGVYSKVIPYEMCTDERAALVACSEEEPYW